MSYLVLARKYRPQRFEDIVGQEHVTRTLQNAIERGRLHHAFLFTGARGVGKTTAARILAKALSCESGPTPTPCNACECCREITTGQSVDVQEIDAASNRGVDDIRTLREAIRYAPVRGRRKVYVLDEVHMLTTEAWNALLKTLEEPPPHALFILATTDPHKLPSTILSRVQRYDFKLVPVRTIVQHVSRILTDEQITFEPAALTLVARESGGSVRDSLSLLDQVITAAGVATERLELTESGVAETLGVADRSLLHSLGRALLTRDGAAALELVDRAFARGYDLPQLSQALLGHLRDLLVAQLVPEPGALLELSSTETEALQAEVRGIPAGLLELLFNRLAARIDDIARSPLPRYVLEVTLIELTRVEPLESVTALLHKLESLEVRLEQRGATATGRAPSGGAPSGGAPSGGGTSSGGPSSGGGRGASSTESPPSRRSPSPSPAPSGPSPRRDSAPAEARWEPSAAPERFDEWDLPSSGGEHPFAPSPPRPASGSSAPPLSRPASSSASVSAAAPLDAAVAEPAPRASHSPRGAGSASTSSSTGPRASHPFMSEENPALAALRALESGVRLAEPEPAPEPQRPPGDFTALVEGVIAHDPLLGALAQGRLLEWGDEQLVIGFDADFAAEVVRERLPSLREALLALLKRPFEVELVVTHRKGAATLLEVEQQRQAQDREQRRQEALSHPARQLLEQAFGGIWQEPVVELAALEQGDRT